MTSPMKLGAVLALSLSGSALSPVFAAFPATPPTQQTPTARALPDFSGLVKQYGPAVVNISTTAKARTGAQGIPVGIEPRDPFYEFFRQFGGQVPSPGGEQLRQGVGSGFIISGDGYILTNAHVAADAAEVNVKLTDKREFKAKVIGADMRADVALVKIEGKGLPTVKIGDPKKASVGEWVAAKARRSAWRTP